jgi:hypothetical protein
MANFKTKHYPRTQVKLKSCGQRCWNLERDDAKHASVKREIIEQDII